MHYIKCFQASRVPTVGPWVLFLEADDAPMSILWPGKACLKTTQFENSSCTIGDACDW